MPCTWDPRQIAGLERVGTWGPTRRNWVVQGRSSSPTPTGEGSVQPRSQPGSTGSASSRLFALNKAPTSLSQILDDQWEGVLLWDVSQSVLVCAVPGKCDPLGGGGENRSWTRPGCGQSGVDAGVSGPSDGCTLISLWVCPWEGTAVTLCPCHMWLTIQF